MRTSSVSNADIISALLRAETLVMYLSAQGVKVKGVSLRNTQPVIRIVRHAWCERMKKEGLARFDITGNDRHGRFRQGVYQDESGCRVVWSESLH
ncbi:TPA: hypothetical protein MPJ72_001787 [Enterobacter asburiae]|uniref:hypothetical protein n=1 Tax=Citrobacter TaxID=544 RepID=UPI001906E740|nr:MULTISPECIES: hypothetical protein [Citrobacter]HBO0721815.1 hypothetical protein [Enterobacter asburiae]MBJ9081107.1 hypothetical protein [Citrobacter amalonaticus]MCK8145621.1 hypothetical protein [Citrobacter sedlakii]HCA3849485.1 hypothetical protein [Enterobacter asburiae]HDS9624419.1 hypothetical protein [Enterobacter asburiae]